MFHFKFFTPQQIKDILSALASLVEPNNSVFLADLKPLKPSGIDQTLAAGVVAGSASGVYVEQILLERSQCFDCATKIEEGLWSTLTPEQKELALRYFDTSYWQHKLAFVNWAPLGIPALMLAPRLLDRFSNDLSATVEWFSLTLPFTQQRAVMSEGWELLHGMQTERFDSKVIRFLSTAGCLALGMLAVAYGGISGQAFLAKFASLLSTAAMGSSVFGMLTSGVYAGMAGQESSKQGLRLWNKLRSGLPLDALMKMTPQEEKQACENLSLTYFAGWSWFNKLRIRLASGSSSLTAKAWVKEPIDNQEYRYRIDKKLNSHDDLFSWIGAVVLCAVGFIFFGPIGAIVGALLGHYLGNKLGATFSYHAKPTDLNPDTAVGGINKVLYEQLEHCKYKLLKQNIFTHLYKSYYRNVYENCPGGKATKIIAAVVLGTCAIILDVLKTLFFLPWNICKNIYNYFSPGLLWSKLQFTCYTLAKQYENVHSASEVLLFVGKTIINVLVSLVILALKFPKLILGAALAIFNPLQHTDYMKQQNELQAEKTWLKQELNLHGLAVTQASDHKQVQEINTAFTKRYRTQVEEKCKRKTTESCGDTWKSVMTFFKVNPAAARKEEKMDKYNQALSDAGSSYVLVA